MFVIQWKSETGFMYYRSESGANDGAGCWVVGREQATRYAREPEADAVADRLALSHKGPIDVFPAVTIEQILSLSVDVFGPGAPVLTDNQYLAIKCIINERDELRAALLPFAAAAGRPGRLIDGMSGNPLPDEAALSVGVKVAAWKKAIELTGCS